MIKLQDLSVAHKQGYELRTVVHEVNPRLTLASVLVWWVRQAAASRRCCGCWQV